MFARDVGDVATADADIVQLAIAETLKLGVCVVIFDRTGAGFLHAFNKVCDAGAQIEAAMCQCCCMCHISVPFECRGAFPEVTYFVPSLDREEIGALGNANNSSFGLADMRLVNGKIDTQTVLCIKGL